MSWWYLAGMLTGAELRRMREAAGLMRRELGRLIGVNGLAIRNVKLGRVRDERIEAKMRAYFEREHTGIAG